MQAAVIDIIPILKKQYKLLGEALLNPKDSAYKIIYIPTGVQKGFADGEGTPSPGNFLTFYVSVSHHILVGVCISPPKILRQLQLLTQITFLIL
jgi:hypothetical protein